jgi:hypothetical protein
MLSGLQGGVQSVNVRSKVSNHKKVWHKDRERHASTNEPQAFCHGSSTRRNLLVALGVGRYTSEDTGEGNEPSGRVWDWCQEPAISD